MGRLGLAMGVLLAVPGAALAQVSVNITSAEDAFYEDAALRVAVFDGNDPAVARLVATFGPAAAGCAADPGSDPRPVVADEPASEGVVAGTAVPPDPGSYRACGWALDASGAVRSRSGATQEVASQPAEASTSSDVTRVWRGVPVSVFANALARRGRVLQAAVLRGPCPAVAPGAGDPAVVRWIGEPAGTSMGANGRDLRDRIRLASAGAHAVCAWVGEMPGDPFPEAVASDAFTVAAGRARTQLGLSADRSETDGRKPVRWRGTVIGAFRGTLRLEARRVVHAPSGGTRGAGAWRTVARFDLARRKPRFGVANFGLAGSSAVILREATPLPASIGRECGSRSRIAQVRLRFEGSGLARPAKSAVVELVGSLGSC